MHSNAVKSMMGQGAAPAAGLPVAAIASTSSKTLATWLLGAGVATLLVLVNHLLDEWAQTHLIAAWLALWVVAVLAIAALRGVSRLLAQNVMRALDAGSANLARRRADQRLWALAQTDSRLMNDLQTAMDRAENATAGQSALSTYMSRRVSRMVHSRMYYI
jgi:ABC-type multidrug transport system fused ATPase/permease subunit